MFYQRGSLLHHLQISLLEDNFLPRALTAGLFAGLLRPADHYTFPERIKPMHQNAAKTAAVGNQEGDGRDPPHDPQHGEQAAREVALQTPAS